jgi:hypothetical protein
VPSGSRGGKVRGSHTLGLPMARRMKVLMVSTTEKCGHNQPQYSRPQRHDTPMSSAPAARIGSSTRPITRCTASSAPMLPAEKSSSPACHSKPRNHAWPATRSKRNRLNTGANTKSTKKPACAQRRKRWRPPSGGVAGMIGMMRPAIT